MQTKSSYFFRFLIALVCIVPIMLLVVLSFSKNWTFPSLVADTYTTIAWQDLFKKGNSVRDSLFSSIIISLLVGVGATCMGFFTSRTIAYHKHRRALMFLAYLPFVLSPVILAVCLKFYFIKLNLAGNIIGVVLAQLIIAFPYSTIFFMGFWNQQLKNYAEVAATLGSDDKRIFSTIIIPLSKPLLIICFFQCFLISWFEYGLTSVIGYGKVQTLTVKVYQYLTEVNTFYAALSCCLLILPPVLLLWLNKRIILKRAD